MIISAVGVLAWHYQDLRHLGIAGVRSSRIGVAATLAVLDYRKTYSAIYDSEEQKLEAISACHTRAANHVLKALLANGGVFIKLV